MVVEVTSTRPRPLPKDSSTAWAGVAAPRSRTATTALAATAPRPVATPSAPLRRRSEELLHFLLERLLVAGRIADLGLRDDPVAADDDVEGGIFVRVVGPHDAGLLVEEDRIGDAHPPRRRRHVGDALRPVHGD